MSVAAGVHGLGVGSNMGHVGCVVPAEDFHALHPDVQPLFRHAAEGVLDVMQEPKQDSQRAAGHALRKGSNDGKERSNDHVLVMPRL